MLTSSSKPWDFIIFWIIWSLLFTQHCCLTLFIGIIPKTKTIYSGLCLNLSSWELQLPLRKCGTTQKLVQRVVERQCKFLSNHLQGFGRHMRTYYGVKVWRKQLKISFMLLKLKAALYSQSMLKNGNVLATNCASMLPFFFSGYGNLP